MAAIVVVSAMVGVFDLRSRAQTGGGGVLSAPWRHVAMPSALARPADVASAIAQNGYLVSFTRLAAAEGTGAVFVTSLTTPQQRTLPFWVRGASALRLESASIDSGGHVLLAGAYTTSAQGAERLKAYIRSREGSGASNAADVVNFVARLDPGGRILDVIDTKDYAPERLCESADQTFWTFGQKWSGDGVAASADDFVLRHYNREGAVVAQYLPGTWLSKTRLLNYHAPGGATAFLACGPDSVGVYAAQAPAGLFMWAELDPTTGNIVRHDVRNPPAMRITGLALLSKGQVYASMALQTQQGSQGKANPQQVWSTGLHRLVVGAEPSWEPVQTAPDGDAFARLLGSDGSSLIHLNGFRLPGHDPTVYWSKLGTGVKGVDQ